MRTRSSLGKSRRSRLKNDRDSKGNHQCQKVGVTSVELALASPGKRVKECFDNAKPKGFEQPMADISGR